jgi:hypothetical protein
VAGWEQAKHKSLAELILVYALFGDFGAGSLLGETLHLANHLGLSAFGCW